jgi:hypothetical protein
MFHTLAMQARTALSPEWEHGFDEAFMDLVTSDPDLVRAEFDALIGAGWDEPPAPPPQNPPVPSAARPKPRPRESPRPDTRAAATHEHEPANTSNNQRSPP